MTSTKSSVNHAAKYDLNRCLKENALIPFAAMIVTSYFLWNFVMILVNNDYYEEYKWAIFTDYSGFNVVMFNMLYMMCGALTAIKTFYFLTSTKRCNVYMSMGIERKTLLKNRVSTSLLFMSISSAVPLIVSIVANSIHFVVTADTVKTALYVFLCFLLNMLLGFGVASAVMLSVGNVFEGVGIYAILIMIPSVVQLAVKNLGNRLFNGFAVFESKDYFGFEALFPDWLTKVKYFIPFEFVENIETFERSEGRFKGISALDWLTLICWFIAVTLIIALLPKLMKKRKAEIAGAFGADRKLVAITSSVCAFLMFTIWCGVEIDNEYLRYALMTVMPVIGYFIPLMVIYRNEKDVKNNLAGVGVTAAVCLLVSISSMTNGLGYFNKTPDIEDVEYAVIRPAAIETIAKSSNRTTINNSSYYGKITEKEDIEKIFSIQNRVIENLGDGDAMVNIAYKLKNGKVIARNYRNVSDEGAKASLEFVETTYYKNLVTDVLTLKEFDEDKEREKLSYTFEQSMSDLEKIEYLFDMYKFEYQADFTNSVPAVLNSTLSSNIYLDKVMPEAELLGFKKALAEDVRNLTVSQTFYPEEKPLYFIHFYRYDYVDNGSYVYKNFPVYSFMTNTLSYLRKYDVDRFLKNCTLDDIERVRVENVAAYIENENRWNKSIQTALDSTVCATYNLPEFYPYDTNTPEIMPILRDYFFNPKEITDKATIERYFNNYRSQHSFIGDDGAFVQFIFKDGGDLIAYIPEKYLYN